MISKKREILILVISIALLVILNYKALDGLVVDFLNEDQIVKVFEIVDGDTIKAQVSDNKENLTIRLLGINAPEKGGVLYKEAKEFLKSEILNKTVSLKFGKEKKDRYGRTLAYIFLGNENINLKIVENGFANFYFPSGKDQYYNDFRNAWQECLNQDVNLCEKSRDACSSCVYIKNLDVNQDRITLHNNCFFSCGIHEWTIKDEGRKKFVFKNFELNKNKEVSIARGNGTNTDFVLYWSDQEYILTKTGDSIFLRDKNGKLVDWKNY